MCFTVYITAPNKIPKDNTQDDASIKEGIIKCIFSDSVNLLTLSYVL